MRVKLLIFFIFVKFVMLYFTFRLIVYFGGDGTELTTERVMRVANKFYKLPLKRISISKEVTVIIRDFELYDNDVTLTVHSFINTFPTMQAVILYDELPYPPLDIMTNNSFPNVKFINLSPILKTPFIEHYPLFEIKTKYVLFVPDSTRITTPQSLLKMITELLKKPGSLIVAPVIYQHPLSCLKMNVNLREWTLKYSIVKSLECNGVTGKHVILLETEILRNLPNAFLLPFPQSLYVQTAALYLKVYIIEGVSFDNGEPLLRTHHAQGKQIGDTNDRIEKLYRTFKIKQVLWGTRITEWFGCNKETARCFGTVLDSIPSYLYEKKWTPPCCLSNLRETARHVFNSLDESGIRYWLEAGSLLGAMRSGDILPWDHEVDVGIVREDIPRCAWLKNAKDQSVVDPKGFLWEKATEGNFYHVHYSKSNKIHVNLFPFYSKNGTMVKDSWFTSHKNMEFPEKFLHPMSSIDFIGRSVPTPNNIRDFLEMKFGKGAIENSEYPDPSKFKFP